MPPHVFEWFVVPLIMFLFLFWLRDNLNILHMPLADLVALVAVADVALAMNPEAVPAVFAGIGHQLTQPPSPAYWWALSALGVSACVLLIYGCEHKMKKVAIHYMSVGLWHKKSNLYLPARQAFREREWRIFIFRWAVSFGIAAIYFTLHSLIVGAAPLGFLSGLISILPSEHTTQALLAPILTVAVFLAIGTLLTFARIFRYSAKPLPWTYTVEDQLPLEVTEDLGRAAR